MRIQHNIAALNAHRNLFNNNDGVAKNLEKLSSGYRINRAGDDAAGLAISEKMRADITKLETGKKNAQDGISLVQTAEGALEEVHRMMNRLVELSEQRLNDTYDSDDKGQMDEEFSQLKEEIDRIKTGTKFNGQSLLDGTANFNIEVGEGSLRIEISAVNLTPTTLTVGPDQFKSNINTISTTRSKLGAIQNRLEHTINNLGSQVENLTAAESRIRDTDMAKEMMAYTKNNILTQAAQAMLAQANQQPQGVLQLLQ